MIDFCLWVSHSRRRFQFSHNVRDKLFSLFGWWKKKSLLFVRNIVDLSPIRIVLDHWTDRVNSPSLYQFIMSEYKFYLNSFVKIVAQPNIPVTPDSVFVKTAGTPNWPRVPVTNPMGPDIKPGINPPPPNRPPIPPPPAAPDAPEAVVDVVVVVAVWAVPAVAAPPATPPTPPIPPIPPKPPLFPAAAAEAAAAFSMRDQSFNRSEVRVG